MVVAERVEHSVVCIVPIEIRGISQRAKRGRHLARAVPRRVLVVVPVRGVEVFQHGDGFSGRRPRAVWIQANGASASAQEIELSGTGVEGPCSAGNRGDSEDVE